MKKTIITIVIAVFVAAASVSAGIFAHRISASREARLTYKNELDTLLKENKELEAKRKELKNSVTETERDIESKNEISVEAQEYETQREKLQQELDAANKTLTDLDTSIQKKKEYIEQSGNIKNPTRGRSVSASSKTLDCPDDISKGRYIAEGRGNLLVYNSSNKLRLSENLSTLDTNSFTFDIAEGESVKVTESVTFTTLK